MTSQVAAAAVRKVSTTLKTRFGPVGPGFETTQIKMTNFSEKMNPILHIDHYNMNQPFFGPHPHAGFCPVSFIFEDSEGSFQTRDTVDTSKTVHIAPGELFWSTAGSGLIHEELPSTWGKNVHGLQIFINLAAEHKETKPRHDLLKNEDIPVVLSENGVKVRVVLGEHRAASSPLKPLTDITLLDVTVPSGQTFTYNAKKGWNIFALTIKGSGSFSGHSTTGPMEAVAFEDDGDLVTYTAVDNSHFVLMSGQPINDPIVGGNGFIAISREQSMKFLEAFRTGKMGRLESSQL